MHEPSDSDYHEYGERGGLADHLVCLWSQTVAGGEAAGPEPVLPDACVDIVLVAGRAPVAAGPATVPIEVRLPRSAWVVGARFHPGTAPSWLGIPASAMVNHDVELTDLWGSDALRLADDVGNAASPSQRLGVLREALTARLVGVRARDGAVDQAVRALAAPVPPSVRQLARALGLGERQLLRRFRDRLGYGPKTAQRILRFQRLLYLAAAGAGHRGATGRWRGGLAGLAVEAGYADQAHMTREVRELAGATPGAALDRHGGTLGLSDLFKTRAPCIP